jgi:putative transposase
VAPGLPHHVTQRGNRRQQTFFNENDYQAYLELMSESCLRYGVESWGYCLMPNHVHLILVPETKDGLKLAVGEAHRRYTRLINFRERWRGHLWQGRFASFIMDERYLLACVKYIELNPVRAGLVKSPQDWLWSSAGAHIKGVDGIFAKTKPLNDLVSKPWEQFLMSDVDEHEIGMFRRHERTGRPMGDVSFIDMLESRLSRSLRPKKPGPKLKIK